MARLSQIQVENFRAFRRAKLDLDENGLVLVAGPNNVGKSALLSALDVIAGKGAPAAVRHVAGDEARVWARFSLTDEERAALLGAVPETGMQLQAGAAKWIEWEFAEVGGDHMQAVAARIPWITGEHIVVGSLSRESGTSQWTLRSLNAPLSAWDQKSFGTASSSGNRPFPDMLESLHLSHIQPLARDILPSWRRGFFHLDPLRQAPKGSSIANANPVLASDGSNLSDVLYDMRANREEDWRRLQELIIDLVPSIGLLNLPATENRLDIAFKYRHEAGTFAHVLKSLGTGVEQLLMTLVVGLSQSATTIILEDPEVGLHPAAQRALLALIQQWAQNRLIIAATHSATMLDWSSPATTILSVSRRELESTVTKVPATRSDALLMLQELGVRGSDVLAADRILILEGPTEMSIFDLWFPAAMRNPRLTVQSGGGGYNAHVADRFAEWLAGIDELGSRKVLYVRDRDELSSAFLAKLEASPHVAVLPCREFENLLLDFPAIAVVISRELAKTGHGPVTADEVAASAREAADALRDVVVRKRIMGDFADPIRLVDHKLRRKFGRSGVDIAELAAAIVDQVPTAEKLTLEIEAAAEQHAREIEEMWDEEWIKIAPGDEVLHSVFMAFLGRGYSKLNDGPAIATEMSPPGHLTSILQAFLADN